MAATTSPVVIDPVTTTSGGKAYSIELSATPGTETQITFPQNARLIAVQFSTRSGKDIDIAFSVGGTTFNVHAAQNWKLPVQIPANGSLWISSTHASATFDLLVGLAP